MDKIESLNHTKWDCKYHVVLLVQHPFCNFPEQ
jgi:REP element-mobilizing transposase RayT